MNKGMVIETVLPSDNLQNYYLKKLPENIPSLLLSAVYIGEKKSVFLKFYNPEDSQIYFWSEYFIDN
jgi:DNA polymerase, archaea type